MIEEETGDLLVEEDQVENLEDVIYEESGIEEEALIDESGELLEEELVEELPAPEVPEVSAVNDLEDLEEIRISNDNSVDQEADPVRVGDGSGENSATITLDDIYDQNEEIIATLEVISSNVKTTGDNISLIGSIISMVLCMFLGGFIIYCFISRLR